MAPIAPDETARELDESTRRAWDHYNERLRELSGAEYERVEPESWDELQAELQRLGDRREAQRATTA
jgi:hypothetical protein